MRENRRPTIDRVYHELVHFAAMIEPDGEWALWKHVYRDFEPRTDAVREISLEAAQELYDVIVEHGFGAPLRRYFGESAEEWWRDYQDQYAAWSGNDGKTARSARGSRVSAGCCRGRRSCAACSVRLLA